MTHRRYPMSPTKTPARTGGEDRPTTPCADNRPVYDELIDRPNGAHVRYVIEKARALCDVSDLAGVPHRQRRRGVGAGRRHRQVRPAAGRRREGRRMKPPPLYVDRYALVAWNYRNMRAREEYRHHPLIVGGTNRYYAGCAHCQIAKHDTRKARP